LEGTNVNISPASPISFHALGGNRKGQYAISINKKWRVCFEWHDDNAYDVEIIDYH